MSLESLFAFALCYPTLKGAWQQKHYSSIPTFEGLSTLLVHACASFCLCTSYRSSHMSNFCVKTSRNLSFYIKARRRSDLKLYTPLHFLNQDV